MRKRSARVRKLWKIKIQKKKWEKPLRQTIKT